MISSTSILIPARALILALFVAGPVAGAQSAPAPLPPPQLIARGHGEVDVTPDRAELILQVTTRAPLGTRAGEDNAIAVRAILDTLRRGFELTDRDLATVGYSLQPQMVYSGEGRPPQLTGYIATNSVRVRTDRIPRVGAMIDAAIAKGATGVAGLSFYSASIDAARRRALAVAVENARLDAETMANAAGGRLGALIEISSEHVEWQRPPQPMFAMERAQVMAVETPIQSGEQKVTAQVTARWRFEPRPR